MGENEASSAVQQPSNKNEKSASNDDTLEALTAVGFKMLVEATKKSNNLPSGKSRDLYESYPSFHNVIKTQLGNIESELLVLMNHTNCRGFMHKKDDDDKFEMIVDANDSLLENVGIALDELCGISKKPESDFLVRKIEYARASWNRSKSSKIKTKAASQILNNIFNQTKHIEKPQTKFKDKVNNDSNVPFEPRIKYKHNMLKPLSCILQVTEDGICHYTHPYEFELNKFTPLKEQLKINPPLTYKSLEETPLVLVTQTEDVIQMVDELEKYKEIAVDLEYHSYRSFQGFTCLLQVSTRDKDYIIDTLALRSELEILNKVFTNPSIVKVFHGADLDIIWLQKDLSVYVVNMFDTHQAAKRLNFPKLSLAYLLSYYCEVDAQKHFQLADWRIRPLPQELLTYAREDTHYLLYIYDNMRNALIENANNKTNLLESVISESTRICLKTYFKPQFDSEGYLDIYHRSKKLFDNRQKYALQQLFIWRDSYARECDESYSYVLPDHMMLNISEVLPREAQGILACCNPVPLPVRQNLLNLHQIILKAREQPLIKPILDEQKFHRHTSSVNSLDNPLQCPHDFNCEGEFRDDLPVLCNGTDEPNSVDSDISHSICCSTPIISVFENNRQSSSATKTKPNIKKTVHFSPYYLYKLSKKFSESVEMKASEKSKDHLDEIQKERKPSGAEMGPEDSKEKTDKEGTEVTEENKEENLTEDAKVSKKEEHTEKQKRKNRKRKIEEEKIETIKQEEETEPLSAKIAKSDKNLEKKEKRKQKKLALKEKRNQFQPFDYKSVDFEKYKSSSAISGTKVKKIPKSKKKMGRKNFKISI